METIIFPPWYKKCGLRFQYSDLKQLLLKAYILKGFGFLFIFGDHMLMPGYENQVSSYISVWSCGFSSAKLAHQNFMPLMLVSQVKLAGNVSHRVY